MLESSNQSIIADHRLVQPGWTFLKMTYNLFTVVNLYFIHFNGFRFLEAVQGNYCDKFELCDCSRKSMGRL